MTDEVWAYFQEKYKDCKIRVVPGHWPDFKSKEEVDKWIDFMNTVFKAFRKEAGHVHQTKTG